jgi:hypothetical protein
LSIFFVISSLSVQLIRNSASSLIKQKLIFAGTERGKLLTLRQNFQEVCINPSRVLYVFQISNALSGFQMMGKQRNANVSAWNFTCELQLFEV